MAQKLVYIIDRETKRDIVKNTLGVRSGKLYFAEDRERFNELMSWYMFLGMYGIDVPIRLKVVKY